MSKQTPVQFLRKKYFETGMLYETDFEKAEQMHREQIVDTFKDAQVFQIMEREIRGEQYYNENYGGNNE